MDIPALAIGMSQSKLQQDASIAVMKMAMDTNKMDAAGLTEILSQTKSAELSVQPNLGGNLDIRI